MKRLLITIACMAALLTGCALPVPTTTLHLNPATGLISWSNPKDTTISGLSVSIATNGVRTISITSLSTVNNPAVITSTGAAESAIIAATAQAVQQAANAATAAAVSAAAMGVKP